MYMDTAQHCGPKKTTQHDQLDVKEQSPPPSPVVVDITDDSQGRHETSDSQSTTLTGPRPRSTVQSVPAPPMSQEQMLKAFRDMRERCTAMTPADHAVEDMISRQGEGSLMQDIADATP